MALLTTQNITRAGVQVTYAACNAGGDTFTPGSDVFLHVKNTNAATRTVTITAPGEVIAGVAKGDPAVVVAATTGDNMFGPFPSQHFADPADSLADITYSAVTNLTIAVFQLSQP